MALVSCWFNHVPGPSISPPMTGGAFGCRARGRACIETLRVFAAATFMRVAWGSCLIFEALHGASGALGSLSGAPKGHHLLGFARAPNKH